MPDRHLPESTDVDWVGRITPGDLKALEDAGFARHGRHWLHGLEAGSSSLSETAVSTA